MDDAPDNLSAIDNSAAVSRTSEAKPAVPESTQSAMNPGALDFHPSRTTYSTAVMYSSSIPAIDKFDRVLIEKAYHQAQASAAQQGQSGNREIVGGMLLGALSPIMGPFVEHINIAVQQRSFFVRVNGESLHGLVVSASRSPAEPDDAGYVPVRLSDLWTDHGKVYVYEFFKFLLDADAAAAHATSTEDFITKAPKLDMPKAAGDVFDTLVSHVGAIRAAAKLLGAQHLANNLTTGKRNQFLANMFAPADKPVLSMLTALPPFKSPDTVDKFLDMVVKRMEFLSGAMSVYMPLHIDGREYADNALDTIIAKRAHRNGAQRSDDNKHQNTDSSRNGKSKPHNGNAERNKPRSDGGGAGAKDADKNKAPRKCYGCDVEHPWGQHIYALDDPRYVANRKAQGDKVAANKAKGEGKTTKTSN